jgi:uncharacterized repeat protein (TIGR03803 family)
MKSLNLGRSALSSCVVVALLGGCGGAQPPIGAPGAMPQSRATPGVAHYKVLYSFNGRDGEAPLASLIELNGTLYGTTSLGGGNGDGTVFSITPGGKEQVLHSFGPLEGYDGVYPAAALIVVNGTLYGTTANGGNPTWGNGTVFTITTSGTERVLHSFGRRATSSSSPAASLIDLKGTLYSTADWGGRYRYTGTVFKMSTSGKTHTLYSFGGHFDDGYFPSTGVIDINGVLYGTTYVGGQYGNSCTSCPGDGTIFSLTLTGTERVLHSFGSGSDGAYPQAPLLNVKGTLYSTTFSGGAYVPPYGAGTVFRIDTAGTERVVYSFKGSADGANPAAGLIDVHGTLYGTTQNGGSSGDGTIFSLNPNGSGERVLHSFGAGRDGERPVAGLLDVNGTLYGTTSRGGAHGKGTVFALTP